MRSRDSRTVFTLKDYLFGDGKLIKINDSDKYFYLGYSIGFDSGSLPSMLNSLGKNISFGVDNSSSMHTDNKKKYILVIIEGPTQGLDDTSIIAEAKY